MSDQELGIIARTMQEVFPELVMWRGDLYAERSIVALVGRRDGGPLDPGVIAANARAVAGDGHLSVDYAEELVLRFYAGNIGRSGRYADRPINTDSHPLIEFLAPRTHRAVLAGEARWMTGAARDSLYEDILAAVPPEEDPFLASLTPAQQGYVRAGLSQSLYARLNRTGDGAADRHRAEVNALSPLIGARHLTPAGRLMPRRTAGPPTEAAGDRSEEDQAGEN